ncbi:glycosyltransferase [Ramlibacter rhizophilus]|uniref:glycosyltransferase n=1 Tax=Ramlibacter rhizophilus TaxID=1781167 RepID=UPI0014326B65|nr:glycosyltransferase [Ramlibacter rhizophilus]
MAAHVKRVLVVSSMYPTAEHPAGGIFVHEQVKALRRQGLDARVVTGRPAWMSGRHPRTALRLLRDCVRAPWLGWDHHEGVPVARFPYPVGAFSRPWLYPWFYAAALRRWLPGVEDGFPYELVHTHTAFVDGRAGIAAARHRGVPMVLTEHTGPLRAITADWRWRLHTQAGIDGADRLIAVSQALRRDMLDQLRIPDSKRPWVVPNGVDTEFFDPARPPRSEAHPIASTEVVALFERLAQGFESHHGEPLSGSAVARELRAALAGSGLVPESPPDPWRAADVVHALWVGHHVDVKRVDRLLDAFAIASRHRPQLRLTLLGSGPLEATHRQRAQALGIAGAVRFLPAADREGVRQALASADFLVLPSETETFGVVVIEALAMGRPVLATACGGPEDILCDERLGVLMGNNLEDIALGLQRMAGGAPNFSSQQIRRLAVERFDFAGLAQRLGAIYDELAGAVRKA